MRLFKRIPMVACDFDKYVQSNRFCFVASFNIHLLFILSYFVFVSFRSLSFYPSIGSGSKKYDVRCVSLLWNVNKCASERTKWIEEDKTRKKKRNKRDRWRLFRCAFKCKIIVHYKSISLWICRLYLRLSLSAVCSILLFQISAY